MLMMKLKSYQDRAPRDQPDLDQKTLTLMKLKKS